MAALAAVLATPLTAAAQAQKAPAGQAAARTIEIKGTDDMKYSVTNITAKPGERIRIVLAAVGSMPKLVMAHNWVLLKLGVDQQAFVNAGALARDTSYIAVAKKGDVLAATALAGAGEKVEVTFTAPKVAAIK
jgi:azurin